MRLFLLFSLILLNLTKFYSQNNSYSIKAIFDPSERKIKIDQTISFYNNEEFEIDYLILNDWANSYSTSKSNLGKRLSDERIILYITL